MCIRDSNYTAWFRCVNWQNCETTHNNAVPLEQQAKYVAGRMGSVGGYIEDADFLKLREVALTLSAPRTMTQRFGTDALSLTVAGRNLATWTSYSGFDPEVNARNYNQQGNFETQDFLTLPPVRVWTARVNVTF